MSFPWRRVRKALKQRELHKNQFDLLRSESIISEENMARVKTLIKAIPKVKSKDPLTYNPDMKHFTGSLHGTPLEPMKEKDFYDHLTTKGVSDQEATELIVRLKAPHENKEKIDKLLTTASKFGEMAKKQGADRKRVKGKFSPLTDKQKERQQKYHNIKKQHEGNAKKLGYDPKHPLWAKPSDPLSSIRNATTKAKAQDKAKAAAKSKSKTKTESILEAFSGSDIVRKYAAKGQNLDRATNQPKGTVSTSSVKPSRSGSDTIRRYASQGQSLKRTTNRLKKTSSPDLSGGESNKPQSSIKKVAQPKTTVRRKPGGTFRKLSGALAGLAVTSAFSSAGPVGRMVGSHLGMALAKRLGSKKVKT